MGATFGGDGAGRSTLSYVEGTRSDGWMCRYYCSLWNSERSVDWHSCLLDANPRLGQRPVRPRVKVSNSFLPTRSNCKKPRFGILGGVGYPFLGTFSEYVVVEREKVIPSPDHLDDIEVAAWPIGGVTSWRSVFLIYPLKA